MTTRDPLGVLESTATVMASAQMVEIDHDRIAEIAGQLAGLDVPAPEWSKLHPVGKNDDETANLVLVLDALNFCFWQMPATGRKRWTVTWQGKSWDGYWALAVALRRAVESGVPLADAAFLAALSEEELADILKPDDDADPILLLQARRDHLNEVGQALLRRWNGSFRLAIDSAGGSAPALIEMVLHSMPSFRDVVPYNGQAVRFYKRAQILIADLHGAFDGQGPGAFHDLETLTAFADYKVPQVLRRFSILRYAPELETQLRNFEMIPPDGVREIEIRSATIQAVELLRRSLASQGIDIPAYQLDWRLWHLGQSLPGDAEPYHRTLTVFY